MASFSPPLQISSTRGPCAFFESIRNSHTGPCAKGYPKRIAASIATTHRRIRTITTTTKEEQKQQPSHDTNFPQWSYEPKPFFRFEVIHESTKPNSLARVGRIHTPNGIIDTPGYVPVATNAALKGVDFRTLDKYPNQDKSKDEDGDTNEEEQKHGQQLVFCNTYHLLVHPGRDVIRDAGGLHRFTGRDGRGGGLGGPFITDSGGFQIFSLAYGSVQQELQSQGGSVQQELQSQGDPKKETELKRANAQAKNKQNWRTDVIGPNAVSISEHGVTFKSYRDGRPILLTPESTIDAQKDFGANIILPLDELPPYHISKDRLEQSVSRSHRWETRSLWQHLENVNNQAIYGIIHGGIDVSLRTKSLEYITSLPFDGFAIGGSLGNGRGELKELLEWMMPLFQSLPTDAQRVKPRHLLGIADEESIMNAVALGVDTLDSCYPTRLGRHGTLMTREGLLRIKRGAQARKFGIKIDEECMCDTCQQYDRAYLNHLFKAKEPLAIMLATQHNLYYMQDLMARIRTRILNNEI